MVVGSESSMDGLLKRGMIRVSCLDTLSRCYLSVPLSLFISAIVFGNIHLLHILEITRLVSVAPTSKSKSKSRSVLVSVFGR